jgi:DNA-nicking Smr family endonuclease
MGEKDSKHSNSSDRALFRKAVEGSHPLETPARHALSRNTPTKKARRDNSFVQQPQPVGFGPGSASRVRQPGDALGEELSYNCGSVSRRLLRDLRRGKLKPRDELDLHGLTQTQAASELSEFVTECQRRNYLCIRVVHGKGLRSGPAGPALKALVNHQLRATPAVLAFSSATRSDGGTGAVYVLLKTT